MRKVVEEELHFVGESTGTDRDNLPPISKLDVIRKAIDFSTIDEDKNSSSAFHSAML